MGIVGVGFGELIGIDGVGLVWFMGIVGEGWIIQIRKSKKIKYTLLRIEPSQIY